MRNSFRIITTIFVLAVFAVVLFPSQAFASITYVGGAYTEGDGSSNVSVDLSSISIEEGDVIVVMSALGGQALANYVMPLGTAGYTQIGEVYADDSYDTNMSVNYKVVGTAIDTSVVCETPISSGAYGFVCIAQVWRGVDPLTPMDVTPATATGVDSGIPDGASITPSTSGAYVVVAGAGAYTTEDTAVTAPSGYSNQTEASNDPSAAITAAMASKAWSSGAEDPAAWSDWSATGTTGSWGAITFALHPATTGESSTIQYVGSASTQGTNSTLSVDLSGLSLQEGDIVLALNAAADTSDLDLGVSTSGFTEVADLYANDTADINISVSYKVMGATPDSSISCAGSSSTYNSSFCIVQAFRGVDGTIPLDVTSVTDTGTNSGDPNPPSITLSTSGAYIMVFGAGAGNSISESGSPPTGYGRQAFVSRQDNLLSYKVAGGIASKTWTSGAQDPSAWNDWSNDVLQNSWAAVTMALRPAAAVGAPTVTTQAVTGTNFAVGNGNITSTGGANVAERGFVYGTTSQSDPGDVAPGSSGYDAYVSELGSFGTGSFSQTLTGLAQSQTYYVRAFVKNSVGYDYGAETYVTTGTSAAVTYVGSASAVGTNSDLTVDLSGLSLQEGDIVLALDASAQASNMDVGILTAGYTEVADLYANDTYDTNLSVSYKVMGATPDSSVSCSGSSGSSVYGSLCLVQVWRGVDQSTPMDVTPTTDTGINSAPPDAPSITPSASGAYVVVFGASGYSNPDTAVTAPSGYSNQGMAYTSASNDITAAIASKAWTSGAEDPAAWTDWTTALSASWAAVTVALRPGSVVSEVGPAEGSSGVTRIIRLGGVRLGGIRL